MNILSIAKKGVLVAVIIGVCVVCIAIPQRTIADSASVQYASYVAKQTVKKIKVVITAYSSTPEQTDDTPFITASGKMVKDGIIANNMLPFGTKVRIPSLYGNKVFTVEDRMNKKKSKYHIDIWMPSYEKAKKFGVTTTEIEVLES